MRQHQRVQRNGQSLIEVLIAVVIGAIMIGAVASVIAPALQSDTYTSRAQTAASLGKELLENVQVWADADWHNIQGVVTETSYYLNITSTPVTAVPGIENVAVGSTTYRRSFLVSDVYRESDTSGNGNVSSSGPVDPSTKKVTVYFHWPPAGTSTLVQYVTRFSNITFVQSDWSGGPNAAGPAVNPGNRFTSSTNVDYTTSTGAIIIQGL